MIHKRPVSFFQLFLFFFFSIIFNDFPMISKVKIDRHVVQNTLLQCAFDTLNTYKTFQIP